MALLSKEDLLNQRLKTERVNIPWMDGDIVVRALSYHCKETMVRKAEDESFNQASYVFVNCVVDEEGKRLYSDRDAKSVAENVDSDLIDFVVAKVMNLSVMDKDKMEAIKKNSMMSASDDSGE